MRVGRFTGRKRPNRGGGGGAPAPADYDAHIVILGDSIGHSSVPEGWSAFANLGYASTTINNLSVGGKTLASQLSDVQGGSIDADYDPTKPCIAVIQAATNDLFGGGGVAGATLYTTASTLIALCKDAGFYVAIVTVTPRSDASSTPTKQGYRTDYNALVLANSGGADLVIDYASDSLLDDPADTTYYYDLLHPTQVGQERIRDIYIMAGNLPTLLDNAPREPVEPPAGGDVDPLEGSGITYAAGKFGQARSVGNLTVPLTIHPNPLERPRTVQAWIYRATNSPGLEVVFGVGAGEYISWNGATIAGAVAASTPNIAITAGSWHHIAIEFGSSTRIYLDGVMGFNQPDATSYAHPLEIGHFYGSYNFGGIIDQIEIYDALLYNGSNFTPPTAPVAPGTADLLAAYSLNSDLTGYF